MSIEYVYTFFGKVFPERGPINIPQYSLYLDASEARISGKVDITIVLSQIVAKFTSETQIVNPYTLRNYVEDAVRLGVDTINYIHGCGFDVEITAMITSLSNHLLVFGVSSGNIEECKKQRPLGFQDILNLLDKPNSAYIRRCFNDLRQAHRSVGDAGFFCYRAIESILCYFMDIAQNADKKDAWEKLREQLQVEKSDIDYVKKFADPVRHGRGKYVTGEDYEEILKISRVVIDKFLVFLKTRALKET